MLKVEEEAQPLLEEQVVRQALMQEVVEQVVI